jgi:rare lipoprotein A
MRKVYGICAALVLAAAYLVGGQQARAECGIASTYSSGSQTANGEAYNHMGISAAHRSLPFGSRVVVRNQRTGRSITVRINDRGPFVGGRIIDLSTGAKNALGMDGLASVCLEVVSYGSGGKHRGYEKPGLGAGVIQALNSGREHNAKARVVRSARGESRPIQVADGQSGSRRRRHAAVHHGRRHSAGAAHHRGHRGHRHGSRRQLYASNEW